jgi:glycopeptide antibiotics resistance protein
VQRVSGKKDFVALTIILAVMVYGELYPFVFHSPLNGRGPVAALLRTWNQQWERGDFLANIVFFLPFGFFAARALHPRLGAPLRLVVVTLAGAAFSTACELTQYFEPRVTSAADVYSNTFGAMMGAAFGIHFAQEVRWPWLSEMKSKPFPTLLLVSWLGYRLYPFEPTIDLHKYLNALRFVFYPEFTPYDFFHYTVMWLTVAALIETLAGQRRSRFLYVLLAGGVLSAKILIISTIITLNEVAGAAAGYLIWLPILGLNPRSRALLVVIPLFIYVVLWRLEPFQFGAATRSFNWIPFLSFINGSTDVNVASFLEKVFYYGSLVWLTTAAGIRLRTSAVIVAVLVLITSGLEIYLPRRSAEISDAVIALVVASLMALVNAPSVNGTPVSHRPKSAHRSHGRMHRR